MKISICIPTYKRPEFLRLALESCLNQTFLPYEVIIGDDSPNNESSDMVTQLDLGNRSDVLIKYHHNTPSLGQAQNINSLFKKVEGDYVVLLHDDDLLLPTALQTLSSVFVSNPSIDAAFGKQYFMNNAGEVDQNKSIRLNDYYLRNSNYEGSQLSPIASAIRQFPNDCYILRSSLLNTVCYSTSAGDACDFDFGLQVGKAAKEIFFINEYTIKCRDSEDAISKRGGNDAAIRSYELVDELEIDEENYSYKKEYLSANVPMAIADCIDLGYRKKGWDLFKSKWHRNKIFTPGGIRRFMGLMLIK